jgi:hypothetical protein
VASYQLFILLLLLLVESPDIMSRILGNLPLFGLDPRRWKAPAASGLHRDLYGFHGAVLYVRP